MREGAWGVWSTVSEVDDPLINPVVIFRPLVVSTTHRKPLPAVEVDCGQPWLLPLKWLSCETPLKRLRAQPTSPLAALEPLRCAAAGFVSTPNAGCCLREAPHDHTEDQLSPYGRAGQVENQFSIRTEHNPSATNPILLHPNTNEPDFTTCVHGNG